MSSIRKAASSVSTVHQWRFFRAGGLDQVRLDRGADLVALGTLDQKLWVALACPVSGLHFDTRTLQLIDSDGDKRIRAPELIAAAQWTIGTINNPDDLLRGLPCLPLSSVNSATAQGSTLLSVMRRILAHNGKPDETEISIDDITVFAKAFDRLPFNGDGLITEDSAAAPGLKMVIREIAGCVGHRPDRSGNPGIGKDEIDRFFAEAQTYADWTEQGTGDRMPLGAGTAAAIAAVDAVAVKLDDYFTRCRVVQFDARAEGALNRAEVDFVAMASLALDMASPEIAALPLARIHAQTPLCFDRGINPAWERAVVRFKSDAVVPLLGACDSLSAWEWSRIKGMLAPYREWQRDKSGASVESLGIGRVRVILAGPFRTQLDALITKEIVSAEEAATLTDIEKLIRFHRDLHRLCLNFVNFRDFYARESTAIFQAGTLYLDQRSCDLCLRVEDPVRHSTMAALAGGYLAYCECIRIATGEKMQIVAAFTDGDSENLMVGRNGVFYDRNGRDWDATITRIVDNPISLRQAFWSPYKNFVKMIEQMIARRAATADTGSTALPAQTTTAVSTGDKPAPLPQKKIDVGTVAAIGVAVGAIGTFFATILGYFTGIVKLGPLAIVGAGIGIIVLISGPSLVLAYIKLRKRNLGPILDANGWAINARAQISVRLGASLTQLARLPHGAQRDLVDPFADKKNPWPRIVIITALVLYLGYLAMDHMGFIHDWTGGRIGAARLLKPPVVQPSQGVPK